jgi:hypothetical protein
LKSKQRRTKDESSYDDSMTEEDCEDDTCATRTETSSITTMDDNETATLLDEAATLDAGTGQRADEAASRQQLCQALLLHQAGNQLPNAALRGTDAGGGRPLICCDVVEAPTVLFLPGEWLDGKGGSPLVWRLALFDVVAVPVALFLLG